MPIESATYISDLNPSNPVGATDTVSTLDNHIRLFKGAVKTTLPNLTGAMTATHTQLNYLASATGTTGTTSTNLVFSTSPTLVTPNIGTPSAGTLTNCTGLPLSGNLIGAGSNVGAALAVSVGTDGAFVVKGGVLGTPSSGVLTNCTGLPVASGISGLGSGIATFLATPSSANLAAALSDESGTGNAVFATSQNYVTAFSTGTSGTVTINNSFDTLAVTKTGCIVTVSGYIAVSSVSSPSGTISLALPYAAGSGTQFRASATVWGNGLAGIGSEILRGRVLEETSELEITRGSGADIDSAIQAGSEFEITLVYQAAS